MGQRAIITGDSIHHPCQLKHPQWALHADTDQDAAIGTSSRLLDDNAGNGTLFIGSTCGVCKSDHQNTAMKTS